MSGPLGLAYSLPAPLGRGGMGRGMLASVRAALGSGWSVRAFCAPGGDVPRGLESVTVESRSWLPVARWTPARFSPAWLRWVVERTHDRKVARLLGEAPDAFQGVGHASLSSIRAAGRSGAITVLESMNAHARHLNRLMREEERRVGSYAHFHNRITVSRCEREYSEADYIYCNSTYTRNSLLEEGVPEDKVITLPLCVDLPEKVADPAARDKFRTLFVGMLDLRKGFRYLLEAWASLGLEGAELYLRGGTGDRPCRRILEDWRKKAEFTVDTAYGPIPYHRFSVLVLPSISDGFGLVVLEAMAAGLPVIVTENVGARDCVREGVDGFVVPIADAGAIAERIETLYRDRARLAEMGRAARKRAGEYSPETFRERYCSAIREVAQR